MSTQRALALVDGEHYPPTTRWALATAKDRGYDVVACVFLGGTEKIGPGELPDLGVATEPASDDLASTIREAIARHAPDVILDLSDEPVVSYRDRMLIAGL